MEHFQRLSESFSNNDSIAMNPNYILEAPITSKDARRRKLPQDICKLIIAFEGQGKTDVNTSLEFFCRLLNALRGNDQKVYAQTIGSYYHPDKYDAELKQKNIRYWFDRNYVQGRKRKPEFLTIECDDEEKIRCAFTLFEADAIAFFIAKEYAPGNDLETILLKRRFGHGYEEYYLKEIKSYGLFIFFEKTHLSLEMLGYRHEILKTFLVALELKKLSP